MLRSPTITRRTALRDEAIAIMSSEYEKDLMLDDVATRIATSRRQLQRCFGEDGFRARLTAIRMRRGAELLTSTTLPVGAIADRVGYRQSAQFAKAFRRHHGVPPAEYRASSAAR